ncbi:MAG: tetratricopeptide repeat protein [Candidatus Heimdallarchaeota archaeon]
MARGPRGPLEKLWRAEQLMHQGKVDEARPLIEALEKEETLPSDDRLTWQLLKSQLLITTGDYNASQQLADQVWKESLERRKLLLGVDASIVMAEASGELGKYEDSLAAIARGEEALTTLTEEPPAALTSRQASLIHLRGRNCFWKGEADQAMDYFQQSLALRQKLGNKHDIAVSLRTIGVIHGFKGNWDQAIDFHRQALKIFQEVGNKYRIGWCLRNIGGICGAKGELDRALEYSQQGLALFQEIGNKNMIAYSLHALGDIYCQQGDLERALEYYQQQLSFLEELGNKWHLLTCLRSIGWLYWDKGEIDRAWEYHQQSFALAQEIGHKHWKGDSFFLGLFHWQKGALEQALTLLEKALSYLEEHGLDFFIPFALFWLIIVSIDNGSPEQAQEYLQRLEQINEQNENKLVSQRYRLAQGLVLKASSRIRDKVRAQEIFQQIAEEEVVANTLTEMAMVNLCELLLDELKTYGEADVLQAAKTLVHKLYELAQDQHSFSLVINALVLQAKLALVGGDPATATQLLEQAKLTADENNLELLTAKVLRERQSLQTQYETWEQLIQRNAPFHERMERARVADYLKDVEKLVSMERPKLSS